MDTAEEYKEQLEKELDEFESDAAVMESPLWERMKEIFRLRREMLMSMVMANEDDNPARVNRLKGRFQEAEYFLTFAEGLQGGATATRQKLTELDENAMETQLEEKEGGL